MAQPPSAQRRLPPPPSPPSFSSRSRGTGRINRGTGWAPWGRRTDRRTDRREMLLQRRAQGPAPPHTRSMSPATLLGLCLGALLLVGAAAKPLAPACPCPSYLQSDCEMQGFDEDPVPPGASFYVDFARRLCTCGPDGNITCASRCPAVPATCATVGSPVADGCPQCVCYDEDELPVPAGAVTARGDRLCSCPPQGGRLQCDGSEE